MYSIKTFSDSYFALLNTSAEIGLRPESSANMIAVMRMENVIKDMTANGTIETEEAGEDRLSQHLKIAYRGYVRNRVFGTYIFGEEGMR